MWPECWPAVTLFCEMNTQWRVGAGGPTGLDYSALFTLMDEAGLTGASRREMFRDVQEMERAALQAMREGQQ